MPCPTKPSALALELARELDAGGVRGIMGHGRRHGLMAAAIDAKIRPLVEALERLSAAVRPTREGKRSGGVFGALSSADDAARRALAKIGGAK